jgi:NADH dehydrogenase
VRTNTPVTAIEYEGVVTKTEHIQTYTAIWVAGVAASPLARTLGVPLDKAGRVVVEARLSIKDHPEVFVVGDLAALADAKTGKPLPGVATVAIQQGRAAADNIRRCCQGSPSVAFQYRECGSMATIGWACAIANPGWMKLTGFSAWLTWVIVHSYFLIGLKLGSWE